MKYVFFCNFHIVLNHGNGRNGSQIENVFRLLTWISLVDFFSN